MPFILWSVQYATYSMSETLFNIRLYNHRQDVNDPNAILAAKHFQNSGHIFNEHARFTIIERLTNPNLDKKILKERIIQRENSRIQKLETLYSKGLNQELNM